MSSADAPPSVMDVGDEADGAEDNEHGRDGRTRSEAAARVLVGGEGGDFVAQTLSTTDNVGDAIKKVQEQGGAVRVSESSCPIA
jgi:hypothetical protein